MQNNKIKWNKKEFLSLEFYLPQSLIVDTILEKWKKWECFVWLDNKMKL